MRVIKGLYFDLDGTLVDTLEANFRAYEYALAQVGRKLERPMYASVYGTRIDVFAKKLFEDISPQEIEAVKKHKGEAYGKFMHLIRPNTRLIDFIEALRPHHTTALVTMAQRLNADKVLKAAGLEDMFDHLVTGDMIDKPKPHPEAYLKALEVTGLTADEALAFEDSDIGLKAAQSAGLHAIKITMPETRQ
jgi:beta-phosphoglucomutase